MGKNTDNCKSCARKKKKIIELKSLNTELENKINELTNTSKLLVGIRGEDLILRLSKGTKSNIQETFDITLQNGDKLEVKYARIHIPVKTSTTKRWSWMRVLGSGNKKDYKWLVLVAEKDNKYQSYNEDNSNFLFFLLSRKDVEELLTGPKHGGQILLSTNPKTTRSPKAKKLWTLRKTPQQIKKLLRSTRTIAKS